MYCCSLAACHPILQHHRLPCCRGCTQQQQQPLATVFTAKLHPAATAAPADFAARCRSSPPATCWRLFPPPFILFFLGGKPFRRELQRRERQHPPAAGGKSCGPRWVPDQPPGSAIGVSQQPHPDRHGRGDPPHPLWIEQLPPACFREAGADGHG